MDFCLDFTYEDFEAMIAELPANMVEEKEEMEDLMTPKMKKPFIKQVVKKAPKLAARPRSKYLKKKTIETPKPKPKKREEVPKPKKVPKLKQPKMKSILFPKQEVLD